MKQHQAPRGTQDLFGVDIDKWHIIEERIREFSKIYGLNEMRTPEFEHLEVFARENDSSDVVNKEMYAFEDRGGRALSLKPEGTAGLIRSVIQHKLYTQPEPLHKYYYVTPCFRYDRPQKGRLRIHHQFGIEFMGEKSPLVDVNAMLVGMRFVESFGLKNLKLHINTLGDDESRDNYRLLLKDYFKPHLSSLCGDCQRRYEQNPLRILDCKVDRQHEALLNAPTLSQSLNQESKDYFNGVLSLLDELKVNYVVDQQLVRGLDYYTHTVFEVISEHADMGSQSTVFGGGRYDHLVENLGGPKLSSVGFGLGIERFILTLETEGIELSTPKTLDVYGISLGQGVNVQMMKLVDQLRQAGLSSEMDVANRSLKAQFKSADRYQAQFILIMGEDELNQGIVQIKSSIDQSQVSLKWSEVIDYIKEKKEANHE